MPYAIGACLVAVAAAYKSFTHVYLEDALITFRFAENIASGHGFVFNLGERVLGTTTPLYTILLALFGSVFGVGHLWTISNVLVALAFAGTGVSVYLALVELHWPPWVGALAALVSAFDFRALNNGVGGMETGLVTCLMMASLLFMIRKQYVAMGIALGCLQLTRPDAVFWELLACGYLLFTDRRAILTVMSCLFAVNIPWWIFAYSYFGTIIPHSVLAKLQAAPGVESVLISAWNSRSNYYLPTYPGKASVGFVLIGAWTLFRDSSWKSPLILLLLFPPVYFLGLSIGRAPYFPWYYVPSSLTASVVASLGIAFFLDEIGRRLGKSAAPRTVRAIKASLVMILAVDMTYMVSLEGLRQRRDSANEVGLRQAVGEWIATHTPADAVVAMEAIGYQGYYSRRTVFDMAGLVSPRALTIRDRTGDGFHRLVSEVQPDYLVLRAFEVQRNENFAWGGPLFRTPEQKAYFSQHYRLAKHFVAPDEVLWGELATLDVFERQ